MIDILLVHRLLDEDELAEVREACVEIFRLRKKHDWPPSITVLDDWPALYELELAKAPGFAATDVEEAARHVDALIARIDAA